MWGLPKLTLGSWPPSFLHSSPSLGRLAGHVGADGLPAVERATCLAPPCQGLQPGLVLSVCLYVYVEEVRAEAGGLVPREDLLSCSWKGSPGGFLALPSPL